MTKNILLIFLTSFIGTCILFSCTKTDSDENPPVIEFYSMDSLNQLKSGDIIYVDSLYQFRSIFRDNEGLSSYSIKIWSAIMENEKDTFTLKSSIKPLLEEEPDSAIYNTAFQDNNIFGIKDTSVTVYTSIKINPTKSAGNQQLPILLGDHYFKVTLMDMSGQVTKDSLLIYLKKKETSVPEDQ